MSQLPKNILQLPTGPSVTAICPSYPKTFSSYLPVPQLPQYVPATQKRSQLPPGPSVTAICPSYPKTFSATYRSLNYRNMSQLPKNVLQLPTGPSVTAICPSYPKTFSSYLPVPQLPQYVPATQKVLQLPTGPSVTAICPSYPKSSPATYRSLSYRNISQLPKNVLSYLLVPQLHQTFAATPRHHQLPPDDPASLNRHQATRKRPLLPETFPDTLNVTRYTVISKTIDKEKATSAANRSLKKQRRVHFFIITKWIQKDNIEVVVECVRRKHLERRQRQWQEEEYDIGSSVVSDVVEVPDGEFFRVRIKGNIKEISGDDSFSLTFQMSRDNYHAIICSVTEESETCRAEVEIERGCKETKEIEEATTTKRCCCFFKKIITKQTVIIEKYSPFLKIPVVVKNTKKETEDELHKLYERQITSIAGEKEESSEKELNMINPELTSSPEPEATDENMEPEIPGFEIPETKTDVELFENQKESESLLSNESGTDGDTGSTTSVMEAEKEAMMEQQKEEMEKRMYNIPSNVTLAKPVISPSSIANLTKKLTDEEKGLLALQLGIDVQQVRQISNSHNPARELEHAMISNYRGSGTSVVKVKKLIKVLKQINRKDLASIVQYAMDNDIPIPD